MQLLGPDPGGGVRGVRPPYFGQNYTFFVSKSNKIFQFRVILAQIIFYAPPPFSERWIRPWL